MVLCNKYLGFVILCILGISGCKAAVTGDTITTVKSYQDKTEKSSSAGTTFSSNLEVDIEVSKGPVKAGTTVPPLVQASFSNSRQFKENGDFFTNDKGIVVQSDCT